MNSETSISEEILALKGLLISSGASEFTIKSYLRIANEFLRFINKPLKQISQNDVFAFMGHLTNLSNATQHQYAWALKKLFEANKIDINVPAPKIDISEYQLKVMNEDEIRSIISQIDNLKIKTIFAIIWEFGLRQGEVRLLKVKDYDVENQSLYVHRLKRGKSRKLPIVSDWVKALMMTYFNFYSKQVLAKYKRELNPEDWLFPNKFGKQYSWNGISKLFNRVIKRLDIKNLHTHSFRHFRATYLLKHVIPPQESDTTKAYPLLITAEILGHKSLESTRRYIHITERDIREALVVIKPEEDENERIEKIMTYWRRLKLVYEFNENDFQNFLNSLLANAEESMPVKTSDNITVAKVYLTSDNRFFYLFTFAIPITEEPFKLEIIRRYRANFKYYVSAKKIKAIEFNADVPLEFQQYVDGRILNFTRLYR